jgi:hypothetical protein
VAGLKRLFLSVQIMENALNSRKGKREAEMAATGKIYGKYRQNAVLR